MSYKRPILKILFCVFLLLLSVCLTLTASADEKEPSKHLKLHRIASLH